jgi:hypothetical protein
MQCALKVVALDCSFVEHSQGILGVHFNLKCLVYKLKVLFKPQYSIIEILKVYLHYPVLCNFLFFPSVYNMFLP